MYGIKLTNAEIVKRLEELRNLRRLHAASRQREVTKDTRIRELEKIVKQQQATIDTLKIQIAELQTMIFGKKKKPPTGHHLPDPTLVKPKEPRSSISYRRPLPPASAITAVRPVRLPERCTCGGSFKHIAEHIRYEEDIPLPDLARDYKAHLVTKYVIERGKCSSCGKLTSGMDLGGQTTRLGPNVQLLICHLITVVGLSYTQITNLLLGLYELKISDGEIASALASKHQTWLPAYQKLKADIRAAPVRHYDETAWSIQDQDNYGYAWVMSASRSQNTVFHLATSRGTRHARDLHGKSKGVRITDDYGVYRNLPGQQQLCWVHLYRAIRDLKTNVNLPPKQQPYVNWWYKQFVGIYKDLRDYLSEPYDLTSRDAQADELWQRLQEILPMKAGEPDKLARLKAQLTRAGKDRLFICLPKDTPCDNNRAERDLRQLVLKRKRSFGSKTKRGAQVLSTVLSICTTTWRSNQTGYFKTLAALG